MPDWSYHTIFRPVLFRLPPEQGRDLILGAMGRLARFPGGPGLIELMGHMQPPPELAVEAFGLRFPSPVGLAAGVDPRALGLGALARFGFGYVEAGPVADRPLAPDAPLRRDDRAQAINFPQQVISVDQLVARLERLPVPLAIRLAPGASAYVVERLAPLAAFFTLEEYDPALVAAIRALGRPAVLCLRPGAATVPDADGYMITTPEESPRVLPATLDMVRYLRQERGITRPILAAAGVYEPADARLLLQAGATLVAVRAGLVFSGPGLPKRINESVLWDHQPPQSSSGNGWRWGALLAAGLLLVALLALLVAVTAVVLPYDETFVGLTRGALDRINPHLLDFMAHDRISYAGATAATALLWFYIAAFGMRAGAHWARQTLLYTGVVGFSTFLLFLGYGYFDPLHAVVVIALLPFFVAALQNHRSRARPEQPPAMARDRAWLLGQWGQLLFVALGAAIMVTGAVISFIGVTNVFVPDDLAFLQTTAESLQAANPRLVPLIAHDRTGFGGALLTNGLTILLFSLWGLRKGARWQWWALLATGVPSYAAALWTHFTIGYTEFIHLLPVYTGMLLSSAGLICLYPYLMRPTESRSA